MKKLSLGILIGIVVLAFSGVAVAISNQGAEKSKAPDLEKIEFIHWKKDFVKPEAAAAKAPKPPACYKFLTPIKIKWTVPPAVKYVINPTSPISEKLLLTEDQVKNAIYLGAEEWDKWTSKELMEDVYKVDYTATYGVQNYQNTITFGNYPTTGVIAVTTVWYNPATKAIVEFDIMFDTDWRWGDAIATATTDPNDPSAVMDLENIATHELGHGVGLADVYDSVCSAVTMYGYSNYEETQKRTLEQPDIIGLQKMYGL